MATKTVVLSDISGAELTEHNHARVVIEEHPHLSGPVELDLATDESMKLQTSKLELVHLTIFEPSGPRRVVMELRAMEAIFGDVDMNDVLANARRVEQAGNTRTRKARGSGARADGAAAAAKPEKVNYATPEHAGMIHRGRITEEEKALVRDDPERASKNREAQTGHPIDFTDPAEVKRYGL